MHIINSTQEFKAIISQYDHQNTLILSDIDLTLITTGSKFIEQIDKMISIRSLLSQEAKDESDNLISTWRLSRQVFLTDPEWPHFFNEMKFTEIYGLTAIDTGKFGLIDSMEKWRDHELNTLGIKFTPHYPIDGKVYDEPFSLGIFHSSFYKGIFYCGHSVKNLKGPIVEKILSERKYERVVLLDDVESNLINVDESCKKMGVESVMIRFDVPKLNEIEEKIINFIEKHS